MEPAGHRGGHRLFSIVTRSVGRNGQDGDRVSATWYRAPTPGRKRLVLVLPIWGSSKYPSRQVIRRLLARRGAEAVHVLEVHGARALFDWPAVGSAADEAELLARLAGCAERLANTVADVRGLIDWAVRRPDVDPGRLGIVGFSMGAIVASLVMGQDERLAAGVIVMGGGHLHQTLGSCRGRPGEARRQVLRRFGWDAETFTRKIESTLAPVDPARLASAVDPGRVLLIDAALDRCMPETARTGLWEAMGRPERISLSYGHQIAFLSMTPLGFHYTTRRILDFLDRRLLREAPPALPSKAVPVAARAPAR